MIIDQLLHYLTDPILRAPTVGAMLISLAASLTGVIAFLRKQSLIGEVLSHSCYPGVMLSIPLTALFLGMGSLSPWQPLITIACAFATALAGFALIHMLQRYGRVRADTALCFILSSFFGIGIALASHLQFTGSTLYVQSLGYLYGQVATMTDAHIALYGLLSLLVLTMILLFYKELQVMTFDREYAKSLGIPVAAIDMMIYLLIALSVVVGIRAVGVILMSGMLIAPAAAARQFTHKLSRMLALAALFGVTSGFVGVVLSEEMTQALQRQTLATRLVIPTGPTIITVAALFCLLALLFAPERGYLIRLCRIAAFRYRCMCENLLKAMWRRGPAQPLARGELTHQMSGSPLLARLALARLQRGGWIAREGCCHYLLTPDGLARAAHIVRLHRLWELYLCNSLGIGADRVHHSAEEMEHILTPEIEEELTQLLHHPKVDPHQQPIPPNPKEEISRGGGPRAP